MVGPVLRLLGTVSSEGGPLLLLDVDALPAWSGAFGGDFDEVCARLDNYPDLVGFERDVGGFSSVVWDLGGTGTADVFRVSGSEVLIYRGWRELEGRPFSSLASLNQPARLADLEVRSRRVAILWSAGLGRDVDIPPAAGDGMDIEVAGMQEAGLLVHVPAGRYAVHAATTQGERGLVLRPLQDASASGADLA